MRSGRGWARGADARRTGLLALVVAAVAVGLFGMHGLGLHGTGLTSTPSAGAAPIEAGVAHHVESMAATPGHSPDDSAGHGSHHDLGGMAMLCVALLAAAVSVLLILALAGRVPAYSWRLPRLRLRASLPRPPGRDARCGPPPEWAFSVIRC